MSNPSPPAESMNPGSTPPLQVRKYAGRLLPLVVLWVGLLAWLGWLLMARVNWSRDTDAADVREWLDETRVFRKSLPELVREYEALLREVDAKESEDNRKRLQLKHDELSEHLRALAEPTRTYAAKLPLFPEVYSITIESPGHQPPAGRPSHPIWQSPVRRPSGADEQFRTLAYTPVGAREQATLIRCDYRLHTFSTFQKDRSDTRRNQLIGLGILFPASLLVMFLVYRTLRRERIQEVRHWRAAVAAEHNERELLEARLKHQEAEQATEDLGRKLLEQELEATKLAGRAAEAERAALELKSQLYASIGIMAGSYAHNIKNLLVRPNDLLNRCMDSDEMSPDQHGMLKEVKSTLGTVTERLQQILRTVRRDPGKADVTRIDLSELASETHRTWSTIAWDKWKARVTTEIAPAPLFVKGDISHLQQAIENLLFNARDATFEMRNHLREEARRLASPEADRKQKLIDAASWKGEIHIRTSREDDGAILEVRDNGIGMTDEVRKNCLNTHFSTKRDNALYEGYNAGMGLGLSFVAVILDHHAAVLEIESAPLRGTVFRVRFPLEEK